VPLRRQKTDRKGALALLRAGPGVREVMPGPSTLRGAAPGRGLWPEGLLFMPALGEAADQPPRLAVNVALKVGQRFLPPLPWDWRLNRKMAKDRNRERLRAVVVSRTGQRSSS